MCWVISFRYDLLFHVELTIWNVIEWVKAAETKFLTDETNPKPGETFFKELFESSAVSCMIVWQYRLGAD